MPSTVLQASVTKSATFNGAGVPVFAMPVFGTVLVKTSALTAAKAAQIQIQSSADGFVTDVKVERQFNFFGALGAVYPLTQTAHDYDMPGIRLGAGATGLASPGTVTPVGSTTGGTLPAATYYYKVTALNAAGETGPSSETGGTTTTGSTSSIALTWAAITGAASYRVYRGTAAGAESVYYSTNTNSYTDTNAASTAGTPPASNSGAALRVCVTSIDAGASVTYEAYLQS